MSIVYAKNPETGELEPIVVGNVPVKGKDYFTDEDKAELVEAVLEEVAGMLPQGGGGSSLRLAMKASADASVKASTATTSPLIVNTLEAAFDEITIDNTQEE